MCIYVVHVYVYVCVYVFVYLTVYVHAYGYVCVLLHVCVYAYVCVFVCVCVLYMYMYMYDLFSSGSLASQEVPELVGCTKAQPCAPLPPGSEIQRALRANPKDPLFGDPAKGST